MHVFILLYDMLYFWNFKVGNNALPYMNSVHILAQTILRRSSIRSSELCVHVCVCVIILIRFVYDDILANNLYIHACIQNQMSSFTLLYFAFVFKLASPFKNSYLATPWLRA